MRGRQLTRERSNLVSKVSMALSFLKSYLFLHFAIFILFPNSSHADRLTHSKKHVALFIFGDSLFDVGNNNYINTTTRTQANFWPYGETFFNYPTGRFSNGRLIPDFIAEYAKLPLLRPYNQPGNNHQFSNGFKDGKSACCGSGPYRGVNSCGGKRGVKEYELCSNPSEYVFFDFCHPTEKANEQLAQQMWKATPSIVGPYNLEALFKQV
ncbi:hypothetical protein RHGRI_035421 [Rhododendron griersonianum]|uniref:Uncharacterized protein n=1 Tax=Rhododendron griersonianum TaxID=479676 RepID=A0AAV6I8E2_9ERIC|nr:hypothetical protein RHGRI_035421 [Rhododendron griersonianum]